MTAGRVTTCGRVAYALLPLAAALLLTGSSGGQVVPPETADRIPIVLDTDIGGDIDDAFAVAMAAHTSQLKLEAVTTVSGDTRARARIAAKLLQAAGRPEIPVAAGTPGKGEPFGQARWAAAYTSKSLVTESAVDLMRDKIESGRGHTVLVAVGPLTNVAALIQRYPETAKKIRTVLLMGGSIAQGYSPGSTAIAESNIASDAPAAQAVFTSGVPLLIAPLDATSQLQMDAPRLEQLFEHATPLTDSLRALYVLWGQPTPTLHDVLPLALLLKPGLCETKTLDVEVRPGGWTKVAGGPPNAVVAVRCDPTRVISLYEDLFTR